MSKKGTLYLIPTVIAEKTEAQVLPPELKQLCNRINYYLVENIRTARRCLSAMKINGPIEDIEFHELSKKTKPAEVATLMAPLMKGESIGVMSEAGCPGIADPGALAVEYAHKNGIKVIPMVGPSSIFLALMASGFSGQSFTFHGYIPINKGERIQSIKQLEGLAAKGQTQIFMETPYRNNHLLDDILKTCSNNTKLCIARDITGANELIVTDEIQNWRKKKPDLHKQPCIFLLSNS